MQGGPFQHWELRRAHSTRAPTPVGWFVGIVCILERNKEDDDDDEEEEEEDDERARESEHVTAEEAGSAAYDSPGVTRYRPSQVARQLWSPRSAPLPAPLGALLSPTLFEVWRFFHPNRRPTAY